MQQDVVQCLLAHPGRHHKHLQVLHHLGLTTEIIQGKRTEHILIFALTFGHSCISDIKIFHASDSKKDLFFVFSEQR